VHLQRTYPCITPFLKGIHLTINSWHPGRDHEGWKIPYQARSELDDHPDWTMPDLGAPEYVTPVPFLSEDVSCLRHLFHPEHLPIRFIRITKIVSVSYGFGDASGEGFGSTFCLPNGTTLFRHGTWGCDADNTTSNFRELGNLVAALEDGVRTGDLLDAEIFLFTDNSTACYYKGNSPSKLLFQLILRLRVLEMSGQIRLHVIHVASSRMIAQGTDGLSRGDYTCGVMTGIPMLSYIPLHLSAMERRPQLLSWVQSWAPLPDLLPLAPVEWFWEGHGLISNTSSSTQP
jgi:hypothetical protein